VRIGFDVSVLHLARAGVLNYTRQILAHLLRQGTDDMFRLVDFAPARAGGVDVDFSPYEGPNAEIVRCDGLRRRRLAHWSLMQRPPLSGLARIGDRLLAPAWNLAERALHRNRLQRAIEPVDVFHSSDVFFYRPAQGASVITVHDLTTLLFPHLHVGATTSLHDEKMRFVANHADEIIAVSECTRRDVIAHLGVSPERVHVVYEGAEQQYRPLHDRALIRATACRYGVEEPGYILTVGTLEPRKNLVTLVEAYGALRRRQPAPPLVLAGSKGWLHDGLFRRVKDLDLERHVRFTGFVADADLPALMNGASLFVYPSLYEGFGLPPLEAMACGVPVITSDSSSLPEVVGSAGRLVPPHDVQELAESMAAVLNDPALQADMRRRGLAQAGRFSWERAAQETLKVYRQARRR
jgi:glycosyltransferase involved in cell wall biosynthesis